MADETNDFGAQASEIDRVETSQDDDHSEWTYYDPDEDQDDVEETQEEGTADEEVEAEADNEAEAETEEEAEPTAEPELLEASDDTRIRFPDGTIHTLGDLKQSPMFKADHTRKTQELAQRRKAVEADATRAQQITEALIDNLSKFIPDEPPPELAHTNWQQYQAQMTRHQAAVRQLEGLIQVKDQAKSMTGEMSEAELREQAAEENQKLVAALPEIGNDTKRAEFFQGVMETATGLGFTEDEVRGQMDHRIFLLAHWARKGMQAEKAKASAKAKVAQAPKTPAKKPGQGAKQGRSNRDAMRKLAKSGSIDDALRVDFDF